MKTFNGSKELKEELLRKLEYHQKLDTFIQGQWLTDEKVDGNGFKGCFYGCTMQTVDDPIQKFSDKYHIDLWYCYLTERIFENLPDGHYQKFPLESIKVLPIGFDMDKMKSKFFQLLLNDQLQYCGENQECKEAIKKCILLFEKPFNEIKESAAESAAWSAESAAWSAESAAWSAESAESAAESAARSAARSAESAAESAARSAESAAESAARSAESAAESAARSAESAARSAAWSAESEARSARSAAWSAAWSAESEARSAAWSAAKSEYYLKIKGFLFEAIKLSK